MDMFKIRVKGVLTLAGQYSRTEAEKIMANIKHCIKDDIYLIPIKAEAEGVKQA